MPGDLEQSSRSQPRAGHPEYEFVIDESDVNNDVGSTKIGRRRTTKASRDQRVMMRVFVGLLTTLCVFVLGAIVFANKGTSQNRSATAAAHTGSTYDSGFNMKQNWGAYSPYFSSGKPFSGISEDALSSEYTLPEGFHYKQVHVLHRHGDRYPAGGTTEDMVAFSERLLNMQEEPAGQLQWLKTWNYTLGTEQLVGTGVANLFESGARFWGTHGRLLYNQSSATTWEPRFNVFENGTARPDPVLRATSQDRIYDSARAWAAGYFGTYGHPSSGVDPREHYELVVQPEEPGYNSSLAPYYGCPNNDKPGASTGSQRKKTWINIYLADAVQRLQPLLPGVPDLSPKEVLVMQDLCAFETAAYGHSAFCELFTEQEWRGFEYHLDLKFYGESGWGGKVGPAQGLVWLTELHARLVNEYITEASNGVNVTLCNNPATFPLGQPFYADFTHDSVISSVLSALQFEWAKTDLSPKKMKAPRQFVISRLTPFGARMYVEILGHDDKGDYARIKLNDRVLNLADFKHCPNSADGLCPLDDFIKSIEWCLKAVDFVDVCYGEHDWSAKDDA